MGQGEVLALEDGLIVARNLCKWAHTAAGRLTILSEVNLAVAAGESVAIVGESGSGKSTLLGLLAGLDTPSRGEVWLDGVNLATASEDERAELRGQLAGFVFQSFYLLPHLTALENVMLPLELKGVGAARRLAADFLERIGLGGRLTHFPPQLSGGEQQRVALARAFVAEPAVLFADEPTGNLDSRTGGQVMDLLFDLNGRRRTALVLVTHDMALAERCGRVVRLQAGQVV